MEAQYRRAATGDITREELLGAVQEAQSRFEAEIAGLPAVRPLTGPRPVPELKAAAPQIMEAIDMPAHGVSADAYMILGAGGALVYCCDENLDLHKMIFVKFGAGAAAGVAVAPQLIAGMSGRDCRPGRYERWFAEFGLTAGKLNVNVDVGLEDEEGVTVPRPRLRRRRGFPPASPVPSGVVEAGAGPGLGAQAKAAVAYYWFAGEVITRCGCARRREPGFTLPRPPSAEDARAYWLGGIPGRLR